jgi:hypothetical protein
LAISRKHQRDYWTWKHKLSICWFSCGGWCRAVETSFSSHGKQ